MHRELIGKTEFLFSPVSSAEKLEELYRLRYQVYCKECSFIADKEYPQQSEKDKYDPYSMQFAAEDKSGVIGTIRLIFDSDLGFPLEEHCEETLLIDKKNLPRRELAEVSRLVISKEYRRRRGDMLYYTPEFYGSLDVQASSGLAQRIRPMVFGLYREVYQESKRRGIKYWYAVMEESLWTLLKIHGFVFHPIGDEVDFYGKVRPYLASVEEVEQCINSKYPDFFDQYFLDGLEEKLHPKLDKKGLGESFGIFETFAKEVRRHPRKNAVLYKSEDKFKALDYYNLYSQSIRLGNLLDSKGIREFDRVALLLNNSLEWLTSFLSTQYLKAIAVPLDSSLSQEEIKSRVIFCKVKAIICQAKYLEKLTGLDKSRIAVIVVDEPKFQEEIKPILREALPGRRPILFPQQAAVFFHTSGTTKSPKVVMLSHNNLISNTLAIKASGLAKNNDSIISILPFFHVYPFQVTCLFPLLNGLKVAIPRSVNGADIFECIQKNAVSVLVGVPQIFALIHKNIKEDIERLSPLKRKLITSFEGLFYSIRKSLKINLSKLLFLPLHKYFGGRMRLMISGAAKLDEKVENDFYKWGFTCLEGYGLTETSPVVSWNVPKFNKIGSVGRPLFGVEVKIVSGDSQGLGLISVKGANVMFGYYRNLADTKKAMQDDWFITQDAGFIDKEGYLHVLGRQDEVVALASGKKVNIEEIESYYSSITSIGEICILPRSQTGLLGEAKQLIAVVVPKSESISEEIIREELDSFSTRLADFQRIHGLIIRNKSLPRTSLGKIKRHAIEQELFLNPQDLPKAQEEEEVQEEVPLYAQKLLDYFSKRLSRKASLNDNLEIDLGLDSLAKTELILELEKIYNIRIPQAQEIEIFYARTVSDLVGKIQTLLDKTPQTKDQR